MHEIDHTTQMDIFYHAMNYTSKGIIDAAYCGAFKRKSAEEANQLIEDLAKCNYKAPFETAGSSNRLKGSGFIEMNQMTAIEEKLDALMNKMGNHESECTQQMKWEQMMKMRREIVLKRDYPMRVPIKLRRHNISMLIEVTILSPTSTCQLITH